MKIIEVAPEEFVRCFAYTKMKREGRSFLAYMYFQFLCRFAEKVVLKCRFTGMKMEVIRIENNWYFLKEHKEQQP